jgi:tight adherence protein C
MDFAADSLAICIFFGVAASTYLLMAMADPYWLRVRSRVRDLQEQDRSEHGTSAAVASSAQPTWSSGLAAWIKAQSSSNGQLLQRLAKAGAYQPGAVTRYLGARLALTAAPLGLAICLALLGFVRMDAALLVGCFGGGLGSLLPGLWVDRLAARRRIKLRIALPDFLDLMIVCLEGGLSLQESVRRVGNELRLAHDALAFELSIVQRDMELGATVDQALKRFAARSDYEGVRSLATFIREAQRFGTNITEALRGHADMLRSQREQMAEESAQKASVKILLPTMLLIFPAIFVVLVGPAAAQIYHAFGSK